MADDTDRYCAFISYSWNDKVWGERLHHWLENYRVPKGVLADPERSRRLGKFFRDDADMAAGADIGAIVRDAIARSDNLIVICSPSSAASQWVRAEIDEFRRASLTGNVFAVIVDGTPNAADPVQECFPPQFRRVLNSDVADAMPIEPVGVDLRRDGRDRTCARLAAGVLKLDFDALWQRDRRRAETRQRVRLATLGALSVMFAGLLVLAVVNANSAHLALSRFFAERTWQRIGNGETLTAARYALAGSQLAPQNEPLYWAALGAAMHASGESLPALLHADAITSAEMSPDGVHVITGGHDDGARLWRVDNGQLIATLHAGVGAVSSVAWAPDNARVALAGEAGVISVWAIRGDRALATLRGHDGAITSVTFFPDGQRVLSLGEDQTIRIWTIASGTSVVLGDGVRVWAAKLSPNGRWIAAAREDGSVILYDADRAAIAARLVGHTADVYAAAFSADSARLVTAGADARAIVWDVQTRRRALGLEGHALEIFDVGFSPDGQRIVTASVDQTAKLWNPRNGRLVATLAGHTSHVTHALFSRDSRRVVTAGQDGAARIWDAKDGALLSTLRGHAGAITALGSSANGETVLTAGKDGRAKLWKVDSSGLVARLSVQGHSVFSVEFTRDGLLASDNAGGVQRWTAPDWAPDTRFVAHGGGAYTAMPSPDDKSVLTAGADGARLWDRTGRLLRTFGDRRNRTTTASFSHDGARVVTAGETGEAMIWNSSTGVLLATLHGHTDSIRSVAFSPDGRFVATAGEDASARVWDAVTGAHVATLSEHRLGIGGVTFSPDGSALVTSSDDGTAIVWDAASRRVRVKLLGHRGAVYSAAFSPDGRRIATASEDKTARIWDARDGRQLATFEGSHGAVFGVAFSPAAAYLATSSEDGFVRIWNVHRLTQPWQALAIDACTTLLGASGRRFTTIEIQSDSLLAAEWPNANQDVCSHVRGAPALSTRIGQDASGALPK